MLELQGRDVKRLRAFLLDSGVFHLGVLARDHFPGKALVSAVVNLPLAVSPVIVGLMAIPYIDTNPKGNGYFTVNERKREVFIYMFGFVALWVLMIIQGTFLRGPNWTFFGPYEEWDVHKLAPLNNVNLSEIIYVKLLRTGLPANWLKREIWGILAVVAYFAIPQMVLTRKIWKRIYEKMGTPRFQIGVFLLTFMFMLPVKMALRWAFNLKYFIAIPEYFFNI